MIRYFKQAKGCLLMALLMAWTLATAAPLPSHIDLGTGIIDARRFYPSPNVRWRHPSTPISLLVIHSISLPMGRYLPRQYPWAESPIHRLFMNPRSELSAHFVIRRSGEWIQYVSTEQVAFHAGISMFQGRPFCGQFSIGIELEGFWDDPNGFTKAQYQSLAGLTKVLQRAYPLITDDHIVGHQHIARWFKSQKSDQPRRMDPGPYFDWSYYRKKIKEMT